jgi:hypothetical protein
VCAVVQSTVLSFRGGPVVCGGAVLLMEALPASTAGCLAPLASRHELLLASSIVPSKNASHMIPTLLYRGGTALGQEATFS